MGTLLKLLIQCTNQNGPLSLSPSPSLSLLCTLTMRKCFAWVATYSCFINLARKCSFKSSLHAIGLPCHFLLLSLYWCCFWLNTRQAKKYRIGVHWCWMDEEQRIDGIRRTMRVGLPLRLKKRYCRLIGTNLFIQILIRNVINRIRMEINWIIFNFVYNLSGMAILNIT